MFATQPGQRTHFARTNNFTPRICDPFHWPAAVDLLHHLTCSSCTLLVAPPVAQCRKGHLYCRNCRNNNSCKICKQTFVDAPNIALEKILSLIALPCKYRSVRQNHNFWILSCPSAWIFNTKRHLRKIIPALKLLIIPSFQPAWLSWISIPALQAAARDSLPVQTCHLQVYPPWVWPGFLC